MKFVVKSRPGGVVDWHLVRWLHISLMVKVTGSNLRRYIKSGLARSQLVRIEYAITREMRATKRKYQKKKTSFAIMQEIFIVGSSTVDTGHCCGYYSLGSLPST